MGISWLIYFGYIIITNIQSLDMDLIFETESKNTARIAILYHETYSIELLYRLEMSSNRFGILRANIDRGKIML